MQAPQVGTEIRKEIAPEAELVRRVPQRESEAFADLITPHFKPLKSLVRRMLRNEFDSDDIVQQAILKAYTHLDQFRSHASFRTGLTSIALNEKNTSRLLYDGGKFTESAVSAHCESPSELYERKRVVRRVRNAVAKLPLNYRMVIEVFDLSESSLSETQSVLRISAGTAETRIFRGSPSAWQISNGSRPGRYQTSGRKKSGLGRNVIVLTIPELDSLAIYLREPDQICGADVPRKVLRSPGNVESRTGDLIRKRRLFPRRLARRTAQHWRISTLCQSLERSNV